MRQPDYDYHRKQSLNHPHRYSSWRKQRLQMILMVFVGGAIVIGLLVMAYYK